MKGNVARMPDIAVFSDELRDGLCGPVWEKDKGAFLAGVPGGEASVSLVLWVRLNIRKCAVIR